MSISACLLALFLSYQAGITFFTHTHDIDGYVFAHSHPYSGASHNHSSSQLFSLAHISAYWGDVVVDCKCLAAGFIVEGTIGVVADVNFDAVAHLSGVGLRAPPFCC